MANGKPKLTEQVKVMFDECMLDDLKDEALELDRSVSDLIRHICALHLYGHAGRVRRRQEKTKDHES